MRVALLSAFPFADRHRYKETVVRGLAAAPEVSEVALAYAFSDLRGALAVAPKVYSAERIVQAGLRVARARLAPTRRITDVGAGGATPLLRLATELGIPVGRFGRYADPDCLEFVTGFRPDVILNLGGMYVPEALLSAATHGAVGGHYARLPEIRGADTVRWSILLDEPLVVSHQRLGVRYDMGDVLSRTPVPVQRGDTIDAIRARCQHVHADGLLALVDAIARGPVPGEPQRRADGSYFRRMGTTLIARVDAILAAGTYSHYAAAP